MPARRKPPTARAPRKKAPTRAPARRDAGLQRRQFDFAAEAAHVWAWSWDIASDRLYWMTPPGGLLGPPPVSGQYPDFRALVHPDDLAAYRSAGQNALARLGPAQRTAPYDVRFRVRRTDGIVRWLHARGRAEADSDGRPLRMIGVTVDVHEQHEADERRHVAEARLRRALDGAEAVLWEGNDRGDLYLSDGWGRMVGGPPGPARIPVRSLYADVHPDDLAAGRGALIAALKDPAQRLAFQYRFRKADGSWMWISTRGTVTRRDPKTGRALSMSGVVVDVTAERRVQSLLELQRSLLERIARDEPVDNVLVALLLGAESLARDVRATYLAISPEGRLVHSLGPSMPAEYHAAIEGEAIGPRVGSCGTAAWRKEAVFVRDIATDPLWEDYRALALPLGLRACWSQPVFSGDGQVLGTFALYTGEARDPSAWEQRMLATLAPIAATAVERDRQRAQILALNERLEERVQQRTAQLEQTNRQLAELVRELEAFSYSVSHDLKAPLRAIGGFARMVVDDEGPALSDDGRRKLAVIEENARRMGELVEALLALARVNRADLQRMPLDMGALAREILESFGERASGVVVRVAGALPTADADPQLVRQLLANLMDNAVKYSARAAEPLVEIGWDATPRAWFVRDNGAGFDMAYVEKLFRAFERLHAPTDFPGTGIGLAIVKRVAERHGGRVWAEGAPGKGATFWFTLGPA